MADAILRGLTLTVETTLVTETCCQCGLLFAMTEDFKKEKLKHRNEHNRRSFYCPNGHQQYYTGQTEEEKLRREAAELKRQRDYQEQQRWRAEEEATRERNRANGYKGHATKLTKRVKAGVCICCNRTFQDLARHMATKHPQLTPIDIDQTGATVQ